MSKRGNAEWPDKKIIAANLQLRKLFDQRHDSEWPNWAVEIRDVRLELRKPLDRSPKAFHALMRYLVESGGDYQSLLPPQSPKTSSREEKTAEDGWHRGSVGVLEGSYDSGTWRTADAIEAQLKRAEALVKIDPDFAEDVAFWQDCLADKYLGAVLWGRKNA